MYINIHSHCTAGADNVSIQNLHAGFNNAVNPGRYSIGLHPWYISKETWQKEFKDLQKWSKSNYVFAIGECGLDNIYATDFALQKEVFAAQITLANQTDKPLIIHCVKAFDEVITLLKKYNLIQRVVVTFAFLTMLTKFN